MKTLIILLLATIMFCGCSLQKKPDPVVLTRINNCNIETFIIDSCEYIGNIQGDQGDSRCNWLTHKGNCKFCAKRK